MTTNLTRRSLAALLPALAAADGKNSLPSGTWAFESLKVQQNGQNRSRNVFDGLTHTSFHIDMHETELAPGLPPHDAHHHEHEELLMIREGTLEVTIAGKVSTLGPGSVAYVASNEEHGWRNSGKTRAHYFVLALGRPVK